MKFNSVIPQRELSYILFQFVFILLLLSLSNCKKHDTVKIEKPQTDLLSIMESTQKEIGAPGYWVGIYTPSETIVLADGLANIEGNIKARTDDLLRIGSVTKTFVATLTLILCDEGKFQLNDKLNQFYPEFPQSDQISIRQLLMHTSGLTTWDENDSIRNLIYEGESQISIDDLIDWGSKQELLSPPGSHYHYSNIGYFLLGKIIEQANQTTVSEAIEEKIAIPLGLKNTFMAEVPHPEGETIHAYDESSGQILDMTGTSQADAINFELAWTAGGMFSTLDDLHIWSAALANGDLISGSLHEQQLPLMHPPNEHQPFAEGYGMGLSQTDVWLGHNGAICGYITNMSYYPAEETSVITFFNKFSAFNEEQNYKDFMAVYRNYIDLRRLVCPETLQE